MATNSQLSNLEPKKKTYPRDKLTFEDVYKELCNELNTLTSDILKYQESLESEHSSFMATVSSTASQSYEAIPVVNVRALTEERAHILNSLNINLNSTPVEFSKFRAQTTLDLLDTMRTDTNTCEQATELLKTMNECEKQELTGFTDNLHKLDEMLRDRKDEKIAKIARLVNKDFEQCKRDLGVVLDNVFGERRPEVKKLFNSLVESKGLWIDTSNTNPVDVIETLQQGGLIEIHPKDKHLCRILS